MDSQQGSGIAVEKVGTNYYDLNDIIACNSSVSCSFGRTNPKGILALTGQSVTNLSVSRGYRADIPLFLAQTVYRTGLGRIYLTFPFNNRAQDVLQADPENINLEALHQHFYRTGQRLAVIAGMLSTLFCLVYKGEAERLAETLLNTFLRRLPKIITTAVNSYAKPRKLDSIEKRIHAIGMYTEALMTDWFDFIEEGCKRRATSLKLSL
ncbi:unnamed protein product [Enterobius vermicularis]|uniref:DNA replication complex GINS protein PSF3 n=1 Tax=Enterobius vermicularis TaxID=51028 RepID=A0A0N4VJE8_ENTVE|nr:unnamed protein product [Enterobius vermicularis]